ncbi:MAG: T9SS type A sorting domain-containing protein [Bacteroidetes bacterium]|nr:T9SS type A sorting domain-containing protein [Bacteroidota bacterium]
MKKLILLMALTVFPFTLLVSQQTSIWDQVPEEIRERNSFKRFEWFYRQRAIPYDTLSIHTYYSESKKEIQKHINGVQNSPNALQWNSIGPSGIISGFPTHWGEMSGRIRGLAVHPTDPMTVYIGASAGSIWKTTNGGTSWANMGDNLASLSYGAIAIDPNNPNTVYAGAGESMWNFNTNIYNGQGMYKSTDAGASWVNITNGFGSTTHFSDLQVSQHNSNIVFAALGSGYLYSGFPNNEGIWRSTDAGSTWTRTLNVLDAFDVIVHPTNPNIVYAATGGGFATAGFYVSTDAGVNWVQSNTGLLSPFSILRMQISLAISSPSTIYALIYDQSGTPKAYKTTTDGSSWSQISAGVQLGGTYDGVNWIDQGFYDLCIAVNPSNANHVFVGNIELHESTDGSTFSPKRIPGGTLAWDCPAHVDLHRIIFAPSNSNYVYIACDGGIYKSTDGGSNWSSANKGITTIQLYRVASHPSKHDTLVGGAQDNGNFRSLNGGATAWSSVTTGDGMECFFDYSTPNVVYLATQNTSLYKSTNYGATVTWLGQFNGAWVSPFFMHPTNNQMLYTATMNVYRSTDAGSNFSIIANNVTTSDFINTMAQSSVTPNNMILAGSGSFTSTPPVKVSTDGGFTWTDVTSNIPGAQRYISRVVTHPSNATTMYVVRSGFSPGNKIYMTTDLGSSWTNVSGDLPDIPTNDFFVDPAITTDYYAANDFGVYRSTDSGANWFREGTGMPFVPVMDFDYAFANGTRYLRAATHGRSVFETDLDFVVSVEIEIEPTLNNSFELAQNYPNPFNPITNISYSLTKESNVKLTIYNPLGEVVETLVEQVQSANRYEVVWNAANVPSGIYFYSIEVSPTDLSNGFKQSKKMILLK